MIIWLIPIAGPMAIAPLVIWATSQNAEGRVWRLIFITPTELAPAPVMTARDRILGDWGRIPEPLEIVVAGAANESISETV